MPFPNEFGCHITHKKTFDFVHRQRNVHTFKIGPDSKLV